MCRSNAARRAPLEIAARWFKKWQKAVYRMGDNKAAKEAFARLQPLDSGDLRIDRLTLDLANRILQRERANV